MKLGKRCAVNDIRSGNKVVLYQSPNGQVKLDVRLERETVWLSLAQISELFDRDKSVVSRHLNNIFKSGELDRKATVAKNATVQIEGDRHVVRKIDYFNLDAIIYVGYRVNSIRGTQFRIWALGAPAHDQSHRVDLRHRETQNLQN